MKKMFLGCAAAMAWGPAALSAPLTAEPPKLIVVISIDQFSADLFSENRARFRHGLKQLSGGVVYPSAYQAHGQTETCAGHSVILSGRHPSQTGIVANQWYDAATRKSVYCTDDGRNVAAMTPRAAGVGPGLLKVTTFGDWLKAADPKARVVTVGGKDRSAIMLGGQNPDAAYWLTAKGFDTWGPDQATAEARLRPLADFNTKMAARLKAKPPVWAYTDKSCKALERTYALDGGKSFVSQVPPAPPPAMPASPLRPDATPPPPIIDDLTLEAAAELISSMDLGGRETPDLIGIGLSGTDMVGHAYGTQGPEMCDQLAHLDLALGKFLARLGKERREALVVVTADHGGADFPERLAERGYSDARRMDLMGFLPALNARVKSAAGVDWSPIKSAGLDVTQLYLADRAGARLVDPAVREKVLAATLAALRENKDVAGAWSSEELAARQVDRRIEAPLLSLADRMALSFHEGRSGDVSVALDPMVTAAPAFPGLFLLGHGSPYDVNRRVPVLFWWPQAVHQERTPPINVADIAPTLAQVVGLTPAAGIDGRALRLDVGTAR